MVPDSWGISTVPTLFLDQTFKKKIFEFSGSWNQSFEEQFIN